MKTTLLLAGLLGCLVSFVSAATYSPFIVSSLTAFEPNGDPDGQVDFYHLNFTVASTNDANGPSSAVCTKTWSDNAWTQPQAYSVNVPAGDWMSCSNTAFSFQLYRYFSIGNFTLGVQQNFSETSTKTQTLASGSAHITNTTNTSPSLNCSINPHTVKYIQHASGSCSLPPSSTVSIPVTNSAPVPVCPTTTTINTTFVVQAQTTPGQTVILSGSVPELGNWNTDDAVVLSSSNNDGSVSAPTWSGNVELQGGEDVQYKYLLKDDEGNVTWECCENREFDVPKSQACEKVIAGNNPDTFRG